MKKNLAAVRNNDPVTVRAILNSELRVKLLEMGFTKGKKLKVLYRAPLGDPIAVDLDGSVLSIRLDEARFIEVQSTNTDTW